MLKIKQTKGGHDLPAMQMGYLSTDNTEKEMTEEEKAENALNDARIRNSLSKKELIIESLKSKYINDKKFREIIKQEEGFRSYLKGFRNLFYYFKVNPHKYVAKDFELYLKSIRDNTIENNIIENNIIKNDKYKDIEFAEVKEIIKKYDKHEENLEKMKDNATDLNNYKDQNLFDYEKYMFGDPAVSEQPAETSKTSETSETSEQPAAGGRRKTRRNKKKVDGKTRKATKKGKKSSKRKTLRKKTRK